MRREIKVNFNEQPEQHDWAILILPVCGVLSALLVSLVML